MGTILTTTHKSHKLDIDVGFSNTPVQLNLKIFTSLCVFNLQLPSDAVSEHNDAEHSEEVI